MITTTNDQMYICPECGGASVDFSGLVGGVAECRVCEWVGTRDRLLSVPFDNSMGSPREVMLAMRNDLRITYAKAADGFLRFLIKWGFVPAVDRDGKIEVIDRKLVVRYMNAVSKASLNAVFEERQKVEREMLNGN